MARQPTSRGGKSAIGVLDIGTSKICCLIAGPDADGQLTLMGLGHQRSIGLKSGMIVEPEAAERAVRSAVAQAERMAGLELSSVAISAVCGRPRSASFVARATVASPVVTHSDMARVISGGEVFAERNGRSLLQLACSGWRLDGARDIRDPSGLAGHDLAADLIAVTADEAPLRNLISVVERCHLSVSGVMVAPYASAYSVTSPEERQSAVLVVDIGSGVTSLAAYSLGSMIWLDSIPVASAHVTYDIARALVTPVAEAERIKTLYGTLTRAASDAAEVFSFPVSGEEEGSMYQTSKARLSELIEPRIEHLLGLIDERLGNAGLSGFASGRVVLTGGGSQLLGLDQVWMRRFGGSVRIGRPKPIGRMPASMASPLFATVIGLALGEFSQDEVVCQGRVERQGQDGYMGRMKQWLSESF